MPSEYITGRMKDARLQVIANLLRPMPASERQGFLERLSGADRVATHRLIGLPPRRPEPNPSKQAQLVQVLLVAAAVGGCAVVRNCAGTRTRYMASAPAREQGVPTV